MVILFVMFSVLLSMLSLCISLFLLIISGGVMCVWLKCVNG